MSLAVAVQGLWLQKLQKELLPTNPICTTIYSDNKGAIDLCKNSTYHVRTKHIDVRHHFVREMISSKKIIVNHVSTKDMVADMLIKGLSYEQHKKCCYGMGVRL